MCGAGSWESFRGERSALMSEAGERARALYEKIREVLIKEWDPIGVQALPEAQDEYDGYIPTLYSMLIARRSNQVEVYEYLLWLETEHMGLSPDKQRTLYIAEKLVGISGLQPT
jgi:hypothetical protein